MKPRRFPSSCSAFLRCLFPICERRELSKRRHKLAGCTLRASDPCSLRSLSLSSFKKNKNKNKPQLLTLDSLIFNFNFLLHQLLPPRPALLVPALQRPLLLIGVLPAALGAVHRGLCEGAHRSGAPRHDGDGWRQRRRGRVCRRQQRQRQRNRSGGDAPGPQEDSRGGRLGAPGSGAGAGGVSAGEDDAGR